MADPMSGNVYVANFTDVVRVGDENGRTNQVRATILRSAPGPFGLAVECRAVQKCLCGNSNANTVQLISGV